MNGSDEDPGARRAVSRRSLLTAASGEIVGSLGGCTGLTGLSILGSNRLPFRFEEVTAEFGIDDRTTGAGISNTSAGVYVNDADLDIVHANNQVDTITSTGADQMVVQSEGTPPGLWVNRGDNRFEGVAANHRIRIAPTCEPEEVET